MFNGEMTRYCALKAFLPLIFLCFQGWRKSETKNVQAKLHFGLLQRQGRKKVKFGRPLLQLWILQVRSYA